MSYLCQWHCLFSTSGYENCMKINWVCTVCRELYFQTIQKGSLEFIFVCAHEYICLLPFGTSCAFSTWGYKNSWGTPWSPTGIPAQSEFRGDGKFDCDLWTTPSTTPQGNPVYRPTACPGPQRLTIHTGWLGDHAVTLMPRVTTLPPNVTCLRVTYPNADRARHCLTSERSRVSQPHY